MKILAALLFSSAFGILNVIGFHLHSPKQVLARASRITTFAAQTDIKIKTTEVNAETLRSLTLFNTKGEQERLGTLMGDGDSVVVFLRHLG